MKVGFVGLGIMGQPMALRVLKAGFAVGVHDCRPERCAPLTESGAGLFESPAAAAAEAEVVITMVPDTAAVEAVLFGPNGVAGSIRPGAVVIDMSTISPKAAAEFAGRLRARSVEMLDAPVSGGDAGARSGSLAIMAGGDRAAFDNCLPLLQTMGSRIVYCGASGNGQKTKMVNQIVGSISLLATVEGLSIAKAAGLNVRDVHQAVAGGAAGSWMFSNLGPKILDGDFAPGFTIRLHAKDLRLAREFVEELGVMAPGTLMLQGLFEAALGKGLADQGNQALYKLFEV